VYVITLCKEALREDKDGEDVKVAFVNSRHPPLQQYRHRRRNHVATDSTNGAGTRRRRDNECIFVVVRSEEAYRKRKKWGRQRSPQRTIYTYKQKVVRTELAAHQQMSTTASEVVELFEERCW
jgi:hypothetical protein